MITLPISPPSVASVAQTATLEYGTVMRVEHIHASLMSASQSLEAQAKAERAIAANNYDTEAWATLLVELQACGPPCSHSACRAI